MKIDHDKIIEKLKSIVPLLANGEWVFHELKSSNGDYYLQSKDGIIINIFNTNDCKLPQFKLCYEHPKYKKTNPRIVCIGCSLNKSIAAIAKDINTRLLCKYYEAIESYHKAIREYKGNITEQVNRSHVIEAIKRVTTLEQTNNNEYIIRGDENTNKGNIYHKLHETDRFNLRLYDLTSEQIIKILNLI